MPRINLIETNQNVKNEDKLLGSDAGGGTRNYKIEDISNFIKDTNAAGVVGQYPYIYYNSAFGGSESRPFGSMTIDTPSDTFAFASVTTIKLSNRVFGNQNTIDQALLALEGRTIAISDNSNQNNFGIFLCNNVSQDPVETNFYDISLTPISTNGVLTDGNFYSILNSIAVNDASFQNLESVTSYGATTPDAINTGGITSDYLQLDTTATPTLEQGMLFWDADRSTAGLQMNGVEARLGQDNFWYVKNQSGSDILKGTAVMAVGALGASGRILVAPMVADGSVEEQYLLGITAEDILNGEDGFVMNIGKIRGIDTTQYGTQAGQVLYCDPAVPGGLTITQPDAPNLDIPIAFTVDYKSNGTLAVRVNPGYHIGELHDVYSNSPSNNDILLYNSTNSRWENTPLSSAVPTPTLQTVTDAGNSTTNSIEVGGLTVDSGTLYVDPVNNRVGIGTTSPAQPLHIATNNNNSAVALRVSNDNVGGRAGISFNLPNNTNEFYSLGIDNDRYFKIANGTSLSTNTRAAISTAGNVLIGTTTDAGYKLDVNGSVRVVNDAIINGAIVGKGGGSITTNTVLGQSTLGSNNTGDENTAIGYAALKDNTSGNRNVALGTNAARTNTTGSYNAALGRDSLRFNTIGSQNSGVGILALYLNTTGNNNTALGNRAGLSNTTGSGNVFLGYRAGEGIADSNKLYIANDQTTTLIYGDFSTGNVMIGTTTDAGYKLDVNGTVNANDFSAGGLAGYTGTITIDQSFSGLPPINIEVNGGIITNVT